MFDPHRLRPDPGDEEDYKSSRNVVSGAVCELLFICLDGGCVRDVYSSLPDIRAGIVDRDVADALPDDPQVLEARTKDGCIRSWAREAEATPLSDVLGTDLEAVIIAAREQGVLSEHVQLRVPQTANAAAQAASPVTGGAEEAAG